MPSYSVEPAVFEMFPAFRRGVLVATNLDNHGAHPEIARQLADAWNCICSATTPRSGRNGSAA